MAGRSAAELFGEVPGSYHRSRPRYPDAVFDRLVEVCELAPGDAVLEVGSGTGIATAALLRRGLAVTGIEPSPEMAEVALRHLGRGGRFQVATCSFESWDPGPARYSAVVSAQAWHWVDPEVRYRKAAGLLRPGGWLALVWNRPVGGDAEVRRGLDLAYSRLAPELAARPPGELGLDRGEEITASGLFCDLRRERFGFTVDYGAGAYARLMETQSDHRRLPEARRRALLTAIAEVIAAAGGRYRVGWEALLYLARRRSPSRAFP